MQPSPVFLSGKSCGHRSLVSYSPWSCKESDMTERLLFLSFSLSFQSQRHSTLQEKRKKERKKEQVGWYTGMTQREGMGRLVGRGTGMGNTCKSMADSCQCMAKTTTIL